MHIFLRLVKIQRGVGRDVTIAILQTGSITLVCPVFSVAQVRIKLPRHPLASASMPKP